MLRKIAALALVATLSGCSVSGAIRKNAQELRRSWLMFRDASAPAADVDPDAWRELGDSVTHGLELVERAADE